MVLVQCTREWLSKSRVKVPDLHLDEYSWPRLFDQGRPRVNGFKFWVNLIILLQFITGRNEVLAKVMFLLVSVILLTGGGVCPIACWDIYPLWTPPWTKAGTPPGTKADTPPRPRHTPHTTKADTPSPGPRQTPPAPQTKAHTPMWPRQTPLRTKGRPPPRIRLMSGRYASYWNAFLFFLIFCQMQTF